MVSRHRSSSVKSASSLWEIVSIIIAGRQGRQENGGHGSGSQPFRGVGGLLVWSCLVRTVLASSAS